MQTIRSRWWKHAVFIVYLTLMSIAVPRHEPWFDEAQAWLLARDASVFDLLTKHLRYEGSPGLWHLVLAVPAKLGLPYVSLNIISAVLAAAGVFLLLHFSPFPPLIKVLYPFSFFAFYQYGVVARSYVLIPVLLFLIAIIYRDRIRKPLFFISLVSMLANVCLHGLIIAIALVFLYLIEFYRQRHHLSSPLIRKNLLSWGIFAGVLIFLVFLLRPPRDLVSVAGFNKNLNEFYPKGLMMLSDSIATNLKAPFAGTGAFHFMAWIFSGFFIILLLFWFILRKRLLTFLMPVVGLTLLFTLVYAHAWHQGTLFLIWMFVMWLSFENREERESRLDRVTKSLVTWSLAVVLLIQACWSLNTFRFDFSSNYSASREVAQYIKINKMERKKIYVTNFHSISILPYFSGNIFCNYNKGQGPCFWIWNHTNTLYSEPYLNLEKYDPDYILIGIKNYSPTLENYRLNISMIQPIEGYRLKKMFDGALCWKDGLLETDSFALYEKAEKT